MNFNFPAKQATGFEKYLPNASPEFLDLLKKMLEYNPDERQESSVYTNINIVKNFSEASPETSLL